MIEVGNTIISREIFEEEFVCNISKCKGQCCIDGDAGAPLEDEEAEILAAIFPKVRPFLHEKGIEAIENQGTSVIDSFDGEKVTPLIDNEECAYVVFDENRIAKCGIEIAYEEGAVDFIKPISCHLYPIRTKKYRDFEALNYDRWPICSDACILGKELKITVLDFLEIPLKRKYGEKWYAECQEIKKALQAKN